MATKLLLLLAATVAVASAAGTLKGYAPHEIKSLPGWDGPLPSRMFSGTINIAPAGQPTINLFYWFVTAEQPVGGNVMNAPLALWSNGGPGCRCGWCWRCCCWWWCWCCS